MKRPLAWCAVALGLAALAGAAGYVLWNKPPPAEPPAVDLTGAGPEMREAIEAALAGVRRARGSANAWGHLGMTFHAHELLAEADRCYAEAERLDPREPRWPYLRGLTLAAGNPDPAASLRSLGRAAALAGDEPTPRLKYGEALLEQGRAGEAEEQFRAVLERAPHHERALLGLGRSALLRGALDEAREHLHRVTLREPRLRAPHVLLAEVYQRQGKPAEAESERRMAEAGADPTWHDPHLSAVMELWTGLLPRVERANRLFQQGRRDDALAHLQDLARKYPGEPQAFLALGRALIHAGRPDDAEAPLREAVRLRPGSPALQFELGVACQLMRKFGDAAACYRAAADLKPDFAPAYFNLGHCLDSLGDRAGAVAAFRQAVRYKADYADAHRELGDLLAREGDRAGAEESLRAALGLNPADAKARRLLEKVQKANAPPKGP
jgi:tetratricopeptide (TPR) repeat protein